MNRHAPHTTVPAAPGRVEIVDRFRDSYGFLSNMGPYPVQLDNITYPSSEHGFAAAKTFDLRWRERILAEPTAKAAKKLGRSLPLRPDWEAVKVSVMLDLLRSKFTLTPSLQPRLLATGDALLVEGTDGWGDDIWGRCHKPGTLSPVGTNYLGRTLMQLRRELRGDPPTRWPRVAVTGHRSIPAHRRRWVTAELQRLAAKLRDHHGTFIALTGLAVGPDQEWASAAVLEGLELWAYEPCPQQTTKWSQFHRDVHAELTRIARHHWTIGDHYHPRFYGWRNESLIGDADAVIAVYDPRRHTGGTVDALRRCAPHQPVILVDLERGATRLLDGRRAQQLTRPHESSDEGQLEFVEQE